MKIQGNDIITQTEEEEKKQQELMNSLLDAVNSHNEEFYEKTEREREEEERLIRENERRLYEEERATFSLVSENERQKILKRVAEEEAKAEEESQKRKTSLKKMGFKKQSKEESEKETFLSAKEETFAQENDTTVEPKGKEAKIKTKKTPEPKPQKPKKESLFSKVKEVTKQINVANEAKKIKMVAKQHKEMVEQQKKMQELERIAFMDGLTGLSNRMKLEEAKKKIGEEYVYVSIDANNLKYLNDTFGHEKGDMLLKVIADGIKIAFGKNGYRMGGDEFCVLYTSMVSEKQLQRSVTLLLDYLKGKEKKAKDGMLYSIAIGFATSKEADGLTQVIELADKRMYEHKDAYKNAHPEYDLRKAQAPKEETVKDEEPKEVVEKEVKAEDLSTEEYNTMLSEMDTETYATKQEALSKSINAEVSLDQIIHKMMQHNTIDDPLYLIAIASVDMNTLVLIHDIDAFIDLCNQEEDGEIDIISCSYIYAIHKSGGHWYGQSNATPAIKTMFDMISGLIVANRGSFKEKEILTIPNINMFKDIYTQ